MAMKWLKKSIKDKAPQPGVVYGVTRQGRPGVGIFLEGRLVGWGSSDSAAWASYQQYLLGLPVSA